MSEKLFSFRVEEEVLKIFKSKTSFEGKSMSSVLSDFMEMYIGDLKPRKEPIVIDKPEMTEQERKELKEWEDKKDFIPWGKNFKSGPTPSTDEFTKEID